MVAILSTDSLPNTDLDDLSGAPEIDDQVNEYAGPDHLCEVAGEDNMDGGAGEDTPLDNIGDDGLYGNDGNDQSDEGSGEDVLFDETNFDQGLKNIRVEPNETDQSVAYLNNEAIVAINSETPLSLADIGFSKANT